jgi:hypothetical protein
MAFKIKDYTHYFAIMAVFLVVSVLYNRYEDKVHREDFENDYDMIQKYLLTDHSLDNYEQGNIKGNKKNKKPILWIHMNYEYNSRSWASFGSRSSTELNQPYLFLTVRSIIRQCSFHICLIDDDSFHKLLPSWQINMNTLANPNLKYMRELGLAKLLYKYGGIIIPPSFLCMRNLINMYNVNTRDDKLFVAEMVNTNITSTEYDFYPNCQFMGAHKECPILAELIDFMTRTISGDNTGQQEFLGEFNRWIEFRVKKHKINMVDGTLIGTKTIDGQPVLLDNLMSNNYLSIYPKTYGLYIPGPEILKRRKYEWFSRLSPKQALESNTILGKYLIMASSPDSKELIVESNHNRKPKGSNSWLNYWQVPSGLGLWGQKPNYLGNHILHSKINNKA